MDIVYDTIESKMNVGLCPECVCIQQVILETPKI